MTENPLLDVLNQNGYRCHGVSPNSFASQSHNFDIGYDEFHYTRYLSRHDGINPTDYYRQVNDEESSDFSTLASVGTQLGGDFIRTAFEEDRRLSSSLINVVTAAGYFLRDSVPLVERAYPPLVKQSGFRSSEINTDIIESTIEKEAQRDQPFFLFANYNNTHYPYLPPDEFQREIFGNRLTREELQEINEEYASEWEFMKKEIGGEGVSDTDLDKVRELYAGEVKATDWHLSRVLAALDDNGIREETIVIVTADHGENLGEECVVDGPRMGHLATVSDHVTHVPLLVASPVLGSLNLTEQVPLKNLRYLIEAVALGEDEEKKLADTVRPDREYVVSQATPNEVPEVYDRHGSLPNKILRMEVDESRSVVYSGPWKIVASTHQDPIALSRGEVVQIDDVPEKLLEAAKSHVDQLKTDSRETTTETQERLRQLGYL
jgi:hypothetical protein